MNENVKVCACEEGFEKGAFIKALENNIFTIFGNLYKNSSILLRYHGLLTEDLEKCGTINLCYYFDNNTNNKYLLPLSKCTKCVGDCYCTLLSFENVDKIHFEFINNKGIVENNFSKSFELEIKKDPVTDLMQRYGFEPNENLPIINSSEGSKIVSIFSKIRQFFNNLLSIKSKQQI